MKAALFENGGSFGDHEWVQRIISHRRMLFNYLGSVAKMLRSTMATGMSRDDCVSKLNQLEATAIGSSHSHEEDMAIRSAYEGAIVNLERDARRDGTSIPLGERQEYVLSQFRERRVALALSRPPILRPGETLDAVE